LTNFFSGRHTSKSNPPSKNVLKLTLALPPRVHFMSWGCTYTFSL